MKLSVLKGNIQDSRADTLIVNLFEGVTAPGGGTGAVDRTLNGAISEVIQAGDFRGKTGEVAVLYPRKAIPAQRVIVVGLGKAADFDLEGVRRAAATAIRKARDLGASQVATILQGAGIAGLPPGAAAQALVEGSVLGLYSFKSSPNGSRQIETLAIVERDETKIPEIEKGVKIAEAVVEGVMLARDLVNMPANVATPSKLAAVAEEIAAAYGMKVTIGDWDWACEHKMGAFMGVARGAKEPARFIVLEYNSERTDLDTIVLVGKGITFDSGGLSLKPVERMSEMKSDMAGAAAVLATLQIAGRLGLPLRLVGIMPCTDNMPDGRAYRPGDVLTASNGKTIEIITTDAEGRLVLADALVYAAQFKPKVVIDLATLTGACVISLGDGIAAGLFSSEDALRDRLLAASQATGERTWPMPLWDDYLRAIKSEVADMKNSGGKFGGVGASAVFLREFTSYPWMHVDMAGTALITKETRPYEPIGATGYGVRLLTDFLRNW